jgi:hypothetical protein
VRGFDPLMPPESSRPINGMRQVVLRDFADGTVHLEHNWRLRRRLK